MGRCKQGSCLFKVWVSLLIWGYSWCHDRDSPLARRCHSGAEECFQYQVSLSRCNTNWPANWISISMKLILSIQFLLTLDVSVKLQTKSLCSSISSWKSIRLHTSTLALTGSIGSKIPRIFLALTTPHSIELGGVCSEMTLLPTYSNLMVLSGIQLHADVIFSLVRGPETWREKERERELYLSHVSLMVGTWKDLSPTFSLPFLPAILYSSFLLTHTLTTVISACRALNIRSETSGYIPRLSNDGSNSCQYHHF